MNTAFTMDTDQPKSPLKDGFGNMANELNHIKKETNKQLNESHQKTHISKGQKAQLKRQEEMERINKISSMASFSNTDFALETLFQNPKTPSV